MSAHFNESVVFTRLSVLFRFSLLRISFPSLSISFPAIVKLVRLHHTLEKRGLHRSEWNRARERAIGGFFESLPLHTWQMPSRNKTDNRRVELSLSTFCFYPGSSAIHKKWRLMISSWLLETRSLSINLQSILFI